MKEYEIGEIFELDGVKMVCLTEDEVTCIHCALCYWSRKVCNEMACLSNERKDKKNIIFVPLNDLGENYHYSPKLGRVVMFKPMGDRHTHACTPCVLGHFGICVLRHFKTATGTGCEGARCTAIKREDCRDGYFVDLKEAKGARWYENDTNTIRTEK